MRRKINRYPIVKTNRYGPCAKEGFVNDFLRERPINGHSFFYLASVLSFLRTSHGFHMRGNTYHGSSHGSVSNMAPSGTTFFYVLMTVVSSGVKQPFKYACVRGWVEGSFLVT